MTTKITDTEYLWCSKCNVFVDVEVESDETLSTHHCPHCDSKLLKIDNDSTVRDKINKLRKINPSYRHMTYDNMMKLENIKKLIREEDQYSDITMPLNPSVSEPIARIIFIVVMTIASLIAIYKALRDANKIKNKIKNEKEKKVK